MRRTIISSLGWVASAALSAAVAQTPTTTVPVSAVGDAEPTVTLGAPTAVLGRPTPLPARDRQVTPAGFFRNSGTDPQGYAPPAGYGPPAGYQGPPQGYSVPPQGYPVPPQGYQVPTTGTAMPYGYSVNPPVNGTFTPVTPPAYAQAGAVPPPMGTVTAQPMPPGAALPPPPTGGGSPIPPPMGSDAPPAATQPLHSPTPIATSPAAPPVYGAPIEYGGPQPGGVPCANCGPNGGPGGPGGPAYGYAGGGYDPNMPPLPSGPYDAGVAAGPGIGGGPGFVGGGPGVLGGWLGLGAAPANAPMFYFTADYLYWAIRDASVPPLANALTGTSTATAGIGPQLFGGDIGNQGRSGARFGLGGWFSPAQVWGYDASGFFLAQGGREFAIGNTQSGLGRVFTDTAGTTRVDAIAFPGVLQGNLGINTSNELYGADLNLRRSFCGGCAYRFDLLAGFRYLSFTEDLKIREASQVLTPLAGPGFALPAGTATSLVDHFNVSNDFYGGQVGGAFNLRRGRWNLDLLAKVALGNTHQTVRIAGSQTIGAPATDAVLVAPNVVVPAGQSITIPAGLFARPSNIGTFSQDKFTVAPEIGFNVGYQVTPHMQLTAGYTFLYWSSVLRVGDQIDRTVNTNTVPFFTQPTVPNTARPAVLLRDTDFWAQGINVGLKFTW